MYIQDKILQAKQTDIVGFLLGQGYKVKRVGSEHQWDSGYSKVSIKGCLWFDHYEGVGGDAIEFVRKYFNKRFFEAVECLTENTIVNTPIYIDKSTKELTLPKLNDNMRRAYIYLAKQRGINKKVLFFFVNKKMIYESAGYYNVVFVGYDKEGKPKHVQSRSVSLYSKFRRNQPGSDPRYSFHWIGSSNKIYFFEAPIDMLSYISMHTENWQQHSYVAACGTSPKPLLQCMQDFPYINEIYICFDNDQAGQKAARKISNELFLKGYQSTILIPKNKDWNEDLLFMRKEGKCQKH